MGTAVIASVALGVSICGAGAAQAAPNAATPSAAATAATSPFAADRAAAQKYNYSPASRTVRPTAITRTTGQVAGGTAILHGGAATLQGAGSSITLDFGKEVGGLATIHFAKGSAADQQLGVAFSESNQYIGENSDSSNGGSGSDGSLTAAVAPGGSWTVPQASLRGGFRYLTLFSKTGGPIGLQNVSVSISFDPTATDLRSYDNYFTSNDKLLNRIWYAGAYTVQTNVIAPTTGRVWGPPASGWDNSGTVGVGTSVLVDGAKRDRTVWPGDLGVSVPTEYASLGDLTPTRNALTTLFNNQQASGELPFAGPEVNAFGSDTYHLWTLLGTANYYQYSHDGVWLQSEWSKYKKAVAFSLAKVDSTGLMNVTGTNDWARAGQGGDNVEANALLYETLMTGAQMATVEKDPALAKSWRASAASIKSAVNTQLWDASAGQYRDNPTSDLHPQDGNSLAVWYGLASAARASQVSAALTQNWNQYGATTPENGGQISTFPGSMEVQAHLAAGDTTQALDLIRTEWGYMLDSPLGTGSTFWEGYLANGQFGYGGAYMSNSHGWATGPTSALTFDVLGIHPTTLTGAYDIVPQTGDLKNASGSLKTPLGDIEVAWKHDQAAKTFTEQLDAPVAAVGQVKVPTYGASTVVTVNGKRVWNGTTGFAYGAHVEGGYVVLTGVPAHANLSSQALSAVPTALTARLTSTVTDPVLPGSTVTIPVTVGATGAKVVTGSVTAKVPAGWSAPAVPFSIDTRGGAAQTVVKVAVTAPKTGSGGSLSIPITVSSSTGSGAASVKTKASLLTFGAWAPGVTATASSTAGANEYEGQPRTYDAGNAVDGDLATFWNDATPGDFPDTLTVTPAAPTTLEGVGFASIVDGVPTDFVVQTTTDGSTWSTQATVTGNTALARWIPFDAPVTATGVRVVVSASQTQNGNYSRIAELTP
ncbi:hypothetical protein AX769_02975 [Frondihabitans sp. PAMC 28766]|uniref:alpha-L-rhamnosidase-related protein n=1 Tax=Frondihabitans sp. PAMC 28766 TaxID=1795630 RepID=UPI00078C8C5A|nr:discoidin domain-containing protein [Frondihabitans sp. PAMC 28766]AMM19284.1 hypothetical protein AX769_02975 [Frondihabitans sp. PAMC 28766]